MPSISERHRADGTKAYFAQIRAYRHGRVAHTESKTFERRRDAELWAKRREAEIAKMGDDLGSLRVRGKTLGDVIDHYIRDSTREIGKTKTQVLRSIKGYDIAALPCAAINSIEITAFARELLAERQPQTVQNYLSHLSAIFAIARPAWGYPLDPAEMKAAQAVCAQLGITAKSAKRDRRPTVGEMTLLMEHFERRSAARKNTLPMHRVTAFAMFSTRRLDEVSRALWIDVDLEAARMLVRDMKHPGDKMGNNIWCGLPCPAVAILRAAPRLDARILPYGGDAISAAFTRACKVLGIVDLRFHDLRHEGVSRLFEMGHTIPEVAHVSGHRSWSSLQRYTHLRASGDKWRDWEWLGRLAL